MMDAGIRPMAFSTNPDGSTKWILVQLSDFNGFAVVDFATHKEINRIKLPDTPAGKIAIPKAAITRTAWPSPPIRKTLVVNSRLNSALYMYSLPDLKLVGSADVGMAPDWVTLTPDGKTGLRGQRRRRTRCPSSISQPVKEIARIPVGQVPKRNITAVLP